MDNTEAILRIADGTLSVSRIKKLAKAVFNLEISTEEISRITAEKKILTPRKLPAANKLEQQYPDQWSVFLEAVSFWVRVRRYWGDEKAEALRDTIAEANLMVWRGLHSQFSNYITPQIWDRKDIELSPTEDFPAAELESLYAWDLQKQLYLSAYSRELLQNPESKSGVRFPLATEDWVNFKREKYRKDCLAAAPTEEELIKFFAKFWQTVYEKRGEDYFEQLKSSLVGVSDQPLSQRPFYAATEGNFRHFLSNLHGFKTRMPWRIPKINDPRISMDLEGAILKYGWRKVHSTAAIALIAP